MNRFIDFKDIENSFSDDEQLDSLRFELTSNSNDNQFDSAIQIKN